MVGIGIGDFSSNQDDAVCISFSANTIGEGRNPFVVPPVNSRQIVFFDFSKRSNLSAGNTVSVF